MNALFDKAAVVTGASSGIGAAIAVALAREGARLLLSGRSAEKLEQVAARAREHSPAVETLATDLAEDEAVRDLAARAQFGGVDVLVHSIGLFAAGLFETSPVEDLDRQYRVNTRVPYLLTQALLPSMISRQGQILFVNSSAGFHLPRAGSVAYAASKHALRALADGLRDEVNKKGVRVITVYPGRTATPMQQEVHAYEGRPYHAEQFLQPEDVAAVVVNALSLPRTAEVTDLHIRPMRG